MEEAQTPPKNSIAEQSKFNRMKSKLQLKGTAALVVESGEPHVTNVSADLPIPSEPSIMEENIPRDDDEQDIHVQEDEDEPVTMVNKKRNQSDYFNRSSPNKLVRVCKGMSNSQCSLTTKQFAGIVGMKCSKLNPELCRFLMSCFDPVKSILDFGDRGKIPVSADSVVHVLGVPMGALHVPYKSNKEATTLVLKMFGIHDGVHPLVTTVENQLGRDFPADDAYLSKFVIYMISTVFAPTIAVKVSPKCYPSVVNTDGIKSLNWAQFIVDILCQIAREKDKKNWFKACMPYLMIRYVDSLETDALDVPQVGTRSLFWTNKMIATIASLDTHADGSFGALPLKACFRLKKLSLFNSEPSHVDMFVKQYLPYNHTDEDLENCRNAVINMYNTFEDGLGTFIRKMNNDKRISARSVKQGDDCVKKIRKKRAKRAAPEDLGVKHQVEQKEENINDMDVDQVSAGTRDEGAGLEDPPLHDAMGDLTLGAAGDILAAAAGDETLAAAGLEDPPLHHAVGVEPLAAPGDTLGASVLEDSPLQDAFQVSGLEDAALQDVTPNALGDNLEKKKSVGKEAAAISVENTSTDVSVLLDVDTPNALKKLQQVYGSASQLTSCSPHTEEIAQHSPYIQHDNSRCIKLGTAIAKRKKTVSFLIQGQDECQKTTESPQQIPSTADASKAVRCSPPARRPLTRSMSPIKIASTAQESPGRSNLSKVSASKITPSLRRSTRFASSEGREADTVNTSMNRNLENEFNNNPALVETEAERKHRELIEYCPSFDLGFDSQSSQKEEVVIISSNEESGDSLDKIYSTIDIPVRTPGSEKNATTEPFVITSVGQSSCTPIPEAHKKRVIKPTMVQKSPFVGPDKKQVASKYAANVYNRVCSYGGKKRDGEHGEKIIDYGDFFVYLWDLANSVRPGEWLSNSTCQIALHVLAAEVAHQKKYVMPIILTDKLRNPNCVHDRFVKSIFKMNQECRLDHKEQICFPVLQDLTPDIKDFNGHYYVIVLNIKAERFEVMDSLRSKGDPALQKDVRNIVGSIKGLWSSNYSESKINIAKWPTEYIDTPKQKTSYDCGYFMLKFIELWNGRKFITAINPASMLTIRKNFTLKWLLWTENLISWQELLF